jgi:hypothetical protein
MNNLLRYKADQKFLFWDVETESLRLHTKNRAWQLGYMVCDINNIDLIKNEYLLWDDFNISEGAAKATRFDHYAYKIKAKDPRPILEEFFIHLNNPDYIILGHNLLNFDCYINNIMRKELGMDNDFSYLDRLIDTNALQKMIKLGIKSVDSDKWYETFLKFSNYIEKGLKTSLTVAGKENNIDVDYNNLHDANEDIKLNYMVFNRNLICLILKNMIFRFWD